MRILPLWSALLLLAMGSTDAAQAQAQAGTNDMWLRGNAVATRNRVDREIRQARDDGVVKRWSPVAIEIPLPRRQAAPAPELAVPPQADRGVAPMSASSAP